MHSDIAYEMAVGWGLAGAFLYATPLLILELRTNPKGWRTSFATFFVAMAAGPILAASFGPWLAYRFHWMALPDPRALLVTIGLTGNPLAPMLIRLVKEKVSGYGRLKEPVE